MAVVRTQYGVVSASTTIGAASSAVIDLPRPADAAETNTLDFVNSPAFRKEFESGRAVVGLDSALAVATVFVSKIEVIALGGLTRLNALFESGQTNQPPVPPNFPANPVFPVSTPLSALRTILDVAAPNVFAGNAAFTSALLSALILRADEFLRITLFNSAGAPVTGVIECRYDLGLNAANLPAV